nr:hypothetical protein [Tanacetum cinerariifolium]
MSWYLRCSWCGGPFNGGNCRRCTNKMAFVVNSVLAYGVDLVLEKEFALFALQAANLSTHTLEPLRRFNSICYDDDDDDDEERTIPYVDPEDSLIMGNKDLNTIPEKESNEFIKSSVEDLVPILSESEDTSESDSECVLPLDDDSLSDEDIPEDNSKDSYDSNLDEPDLLVTPLSDANEDECFNPRGDFDEIDAFLDIDTSTDVKDGYHDSEKDIIYLESLLTNETIPSLPSEVFLDHDTIKLKG